MSIRKTKYGTYETKVYQGVDPATGREAYAYRTFKTKAEAKRFEADAKRSVEEQEHRPPTELTVVEFLQEWLEKDVRPNLKRRTALRYEQLIRVQVAPAIGRVPLAKLSARDVASFLAGLKAQVADRTRLHAYRVLHRALNVAVQWGLVGRNACDGVKAPKAAQPVLHVLEASEVEALLRTAKKERIYPLVLTAVMTGMRVGELCGLRWQDVDLEDRVATVAQALDKPGLQPLFTTPKNRKTRKVPLAPDLAETLRAWRAGQAKEKLFFGQEYVSMGLVFCQPDGRPLNPQSLTRHTWKRISRAAGLPNGIRFHDLRHTFISRALQAGANPRAVAEIAGHHDASFTLRVYAGVTLNDSREAVAQLQDYLAFKGGGLVPALAPADRPSPSTSSSRSPGLRLRVSKA